jgi:hypothetical protein
MKKGVTGTFATALLAAALVAFTSSALAGNNGNGNGNGNGGNSANAPGHTKTTSSSPTTSSTAGVKPSNTTNSTKNTSAPATSNKTKLYGNGKTAGQIAVQNGYTGTLYGPGNSQPHKVPTCKHPAIHGGGIDVHALKSHAATNCPSHVTTTASTSGIVLPSLGSVSPIVTGGLMGALAASSASPTGVLGALGRTHGGVLGAVAAKRTGKLPFTGFPVWLSLLVGFALTGAGLGLRRYARAAV